MQRTINKYFSLQKQNNSVSFHLLGSAGIGLDSVTAIVVATTTRKTKLVHCAILENRIDANLIQMREKETSSRSCYGYNLFVETPKADKHCGSPVRWTECLAGSRTFCTMLLYSNPQLLLYQELGSRGGWDGRTTTWAMGWIGRIHARGRGYGTLSAVPTTDRQVVASYPTGSS